MEIILSVLFIILMCFTIYKLKHLHKIDKDTLNKNKQILEENNLLVKRNNILKDDLNRKNQEYNSLNEKIIQANSNLETTLNDKKRVLDNSMKIYLENIENQYDTIESEFDLRRKNCENELKDAIQQLSINFQEKQKELNNQLAKEMDELDKIKKTRSAANEAYLKEKEIKEKMSFYSLNPKENDLNDIQVLETIRSRLNNPRVLSMLIWSTFFQKPMTALCNNVLGANTITGIYKITNQQTGECYIGQAVDMQRRWKDHAKCGLGIDTPAGNKLYKAMQEDGIWNFTFELLEKCSKEELNKKEKYYIELYDSYNFGYNSNKGVK